MNEQKDRKALVVDDEKDWRELYERKLNRLGYQVVLANSLEEARRYGNEEFDVLIIDGLGGRCLDVYREINAKRRIIISGEKRIVDIVREEGMEAYVKGDVEVSKLLAEE